MNWYFNRMLIGSIEKVLEIEPNAIGFIYEITLDNGKRYIGKKNFFSIRKRKFGKKEASLLTDKRLKAYEMVKKESDWKTYVGSSKRLKEDLEKGVKVVTREILEFSTSKMELTYLETKQQFIREVLEHGDLYYNDTILGKFFKKIFNGKN